MQSSNTNNKRELLSPENIEEEQRSKVKKHQEMEMKQMAELLTAMETRIMASIGNVNGTVKELDEKVSSLLTRLEKTEKALEEVNDYLKVVSARLDYRDQMDLVDCFRITGLPAVDTPKEDQLVVIVNVFKHVGLTVTREDLYPNWNMFQNRTKTSATICGKFCSPKKREDAFRLFKEKTKTEPMHFGSLCKPRNNDDKLRVIRLRSSLTKPTMNLLAMARQHMSVFAFVWEKNGRIFVRQTEDHRAAQIKSEMELKSLIRKIEAGSAMDLN